MRKPHRYFKKGWYICINKTENIMNWETSEDWHYEDPYQDYRESIYDFLEMDEFGNLVEPEVKTSQSDEELPF